MKHRASKLFVKKNRLAYKVIRYLQKGLYLKRNIMELKKNPEYDSKRYGLNFFLSGLLLALLLTLGAFKYTQYAEEVKQEAVYDISDEVEEMADITRQNEPPPPAPPPPPPATVEVVEDDVETPDVEIEATDEIKDYVPTAAPVMPEPEPESTGEAEVFEIVEKQPSYPGGEAARQKFIAKHLVYPPLAIENQKQGTIIVEFIVEPPDGRLSNVKAIKSFDDDCSREAERVVRMMRWTPGEQRGKAVRVKVRMPIKFRLQ